MIIIPDKNNVKSEMCHCSLLCGGTSVCSDPAVPQPILGQTRCEPPGTAAAESVSVPGAPLPAEMPDPIF